MPRISAFLIVRNEAERLGDALASLRWADEIVVLDSDSTDATRDIAAAAGARVVVEPWLGFGAMKNRAAELCRNDWVLNIDADERVDAAMAAAIATLPEAPPAAAYRLRRRNHVGGRVIRHWPWAWDTQVRLYDRRKARFIPAAVHESVRADGPVADLGGILDHLTYRDWEDCARRNLRYATLWADDARAKGRRARWYDVAWRPKLSYWRHLVLRGHALSGADGWAWSRMAADYVFWKYLFLRG